MQSSIVLPAATPMTARERALAQLERNIAQETEQSTQKAHRYVFEQIELRMVQIKKACDVQTVKTKKGLALKAALEQSFDRVYEAYANQVRDCGVTYLMDDVLQTVRPYSQMGCCFFRNKECVKLVEAVEGCDHMRGWVMKIK